jgi:hypothetical protein
MRATDRGNGRVVPLTPELGSADGADTILWSLMKRIGLVLVLLTSLAVHSPVSGVRADGSWLDAPLDSWNAPGMPVPAPPSPAAPGATDPRCAPTHRPVETAEDGIVAAAGWTLFGTYQAGWGVTIVSGLVDHDGMCRPVGYQQFVFVDGTFAGTISPLPMNARTDGAATSAAPSVQGDGATAEFARYTDADPLCCPSATTLVEYRIDRSGPGPVLVPMTATRLPRSS